MRIHTEHSSRGLPAPMGGRRAGLRFAAVGAMAALVAGVMPATVVAQRTQIPAVTQIDSSRADGSVVKVPTRTPAGGFNLFAQEDVACAAYRSSGGVQGGAMNVRGPVPTNQGGGCIAAHIYGNRTGYVYFEMGLAGAAPPSEWRKIRTVFPGARNMVGSPGYSATWQFITSTPNRTTIDAADGQFGKNFSGVSTVFDGSCRDDVDFFREGFSIMAMKDCPVTWGSEGYRGKLVVPDSVFRQRFAANPNAFTWDEYKIPVSQLDPTAFLGAQSFYGYMSDYNREIKLRFGSVVPGGAGTPTEVGYPLGLEIRLDGWQFATPAIRNTQFYQMTMVNKSADLYGAGIDYDSLYYGTTPGFLFGTQNGQALYFDLPRNSIHVTRQGTSGQCSATYPRRYVGLTNGCATTAGFTTTGVYTFTWLKSPLGDTRNKLFTRVGSPFFAPNHPLAGDTITYNRAGYGAFGNAPHQRSTRAAFGQFAKTELDILDGRTPAELGALNYVRYFNPEVYDGVLPDAASARMPKFVPSTTINPKTNQLFGKWDYNHDGVPDTISVPGCGSRGCHELWSDTNPGGYPQFWGNVGNSITAGPFKLKAGDTTQFLWAFTWSPDSLQTYQRIDDLINAYYTNWEGPAAITVPAVNTPTAYDVASAELRDSLTQGAANSSTGARVTIRIPQISPVDQYFLRQIEKVRQDSIANAGRVRTILRYNPGLLDRLRARANDNLAAVYIFKSCDGGTTWTVTTGNSSVCVRSDTRNVDNGQLAFSWRPVSIITYTNGVPSSGTYVEDVMPGRSYLYSLVTRTRGFRDFVVIDSGANGFFSTNVQAAFGITQDTISSALATNGASVVNIYAPITNSAGRTYARVDTSTVAGRASQDLLFANVGPTVNGTTRVIYSNRLIVRKTVDTLTNATTTTVTAQYVIPSAVVNPTNPVTTNFVARSQTFTANFNIPVRCSVSPCTGTALFNGTLRSTTGSSRVFVDTLQAAAGSMGYVWVTADNRPIYVTDNQYNANYVTDQQTSPLYPNFNFRSRDSASTTTGFRQELIPATGAVRDRRFVIRGPGDTLQNNARQFTLYVQPIGSTVKRNRGGTYEMTWLTDPWGPGAPFTLDPVGTLQDRVSASLQAAAAKETNVTVTDAAIAAQVGATTARPLVRVHLPFTMTYTDGETGQTSPVKFAMLARTIFPFNTRLLGTGNDTVRVAIPDTIWMPGDTLFAIHPVRKDSTILVGTTRVTVVTAETLNGVTGFRPIQVVANDSVGLNKLVVSCIPSAVAAGVRPSAFEQSTCNPVTLQTRGATPAGGYLPVATGWKEYFELTNTFSPRSEVALTALPFSSGNVVTAKDLEKVNVVPNPYVVRSDMDEINGRTANPRIWFTHVPQQGVLRIYSVSGQWLQELTWTASDLTYTGNFTPTGDLPYNLRTREGVELSSGLYLYVLTATGPNGNGQVQRGKFVIIR